MVLTSLGAGTTSPSPGGEGRGEGELKIHLTTFFHDSKNTFQFPGRLCKISTWRKSNKHEDSEKKKRGRRSLSGDGCETAVSAVISFAANILSVFSFSFSFVLLRFCFSFWLVVLFFL